MSDWAASEAPELSIVVPVHNEAPNVEPLYDQIAEVLAEMGRRTELIVIDDGSTDETFERLRTVRQRAQAAGQGAPAVKVLRLRRQFGKSAALAAGFAEARGEVVVTMDGDLQDNPKELPRFLAALEEGHDLVSGWKRERHDPWSRVLASRVFNAVVGWLSGVRLHDINCGFKAYRAELVRELRLYGDLHRFVPVLAHGKGFRCGEIEVEHRPRTAGETKYGAGRLITGFLDLLTVLLLTGYASRPLHFFGGTGVVAFAVGVVINLYLALLWAFDPTSRPIGTRPLLLLGVLLMILGIQLVSVGLIGELLINRQRRPGDAYSIAERLD
ncbi:MAG: glycosyltransferase family 2 protein [Planctomycetota bacterium]